MAFDWPLSREEKKTHVLRLYDQDVHTANSLLRSGQSALDSLRFELQKLRNESLHPMDQVEDVDLTVMSTTSSEAPAALRSPMSTMQSRGADASVKMLPFAESGESDLHNRDAVVRLRAAIAEATEALGSLLGAAALEQETEDTAHDVSFCRTRARSEGSRLPQPSESALRKGRERRRSRGGEALQVSFEDFDGGAKACAGLAIELLDAEPEPHPEIVEPEIRLLTRPSSTRHLSSVVSKPEKRWSARGRTLARSSRIETTIPSRCSLIPLQDARWGRRLELPAPPTPAPVTSEDFL